MGAGWTGELDVLDRLWEQAGPECSEDRAIFISVLFIN